MAAKKTGLGRGLEALLGGSAPAAAAANPATASAAGEPAREGLKLLPVDLLERGQYQPRQDFRQEALEELARSIKAQGVVQPIVVRPLPRPASGGPQRWEIVAGERRWRAAQLAGLQEIPAVVRDIPDSSAIAVALIENIQREDLNPLEEAVALQRLVDEFSLTHQEAAEAVGRSRAAVSNLLRLLDLTDEVKALVQDGALEMGHARALLGLTEPRRQVEVGRLVASKGLSVRETEQLVKRMQAGPSRPAARAGDTADPDIRRLEADLAEKLGARVSVQHKPGGQGKLVISYHSLDELDGILKHIK